MQETREDCAVTSESRPARAPDSLLFSRARLKIESRFPRTPPRFAVALPLFCFIVPILCWLGGCAAPGEPAPKQPIVPAAIGDLAARQAGDTVVLMFTLPKNSTEGRPLAEPPELEIYHGSQPPSAPPGKLSTRLVYTVPSALVDTYITEGRVRFPDPLRPEELAANAGQQMVYMVRTRASKRRSSADSNIVAVRVYPVPERIQDLRATLTETAVELSWSAPTRTTSGAALPSVTGYRVYRAEAEPVAGTAAVQDAARTKLKTPLELLAPAPSTSFRDTQIEFGRVYLYTVRSVAQYETDSVESADSPPVVIPARDVFPPAAPKGLVAILIPQTPTAPAHIELSWSIGPEPDLAGYNVYRREGKVAVPEPGQRLTLELLLTPTFRDMGVKPGRIYTYQVTAVDRAGNESPLSDTVSVEVPPSQP